MLNRKGQSTLEYVIIITAIIAAVILGATTFLKPRVESSLDHVTTQMQSGVERVQFGGGGGAAD